MIFIIAVVVVAMMCKDYWSGEQGWLLWMSKEVPVKKAGLWGRGLNLVVVTIIVVCCCYVQKENCESLSGAGE